MPTSTSHPIDAAIRKHLHALRPNQKEIAQRIGRSQGWLNKYLKGAGKATIDDVIRLVAIIVLGVNGPPPLTVGQRRLLRNFAAAPPGVRAAVKQMLAAWARGTHIEPRVESAARSKPKTNEQTVAVD
jgi:transcriptional regulator with XRE-family HTH domain